MAMLSRRHFLTGVGRTVVGIPIAGAALAGRGWAAPEGQKPNGEGTPEADRARQTDAEKKGEAGKKAQKAGVRLEFCAEVDSRTAKKGDVVPLKVVEDVTIDGQLRFRKDAEATGIVEAVDPPGRFGKQARIDIRLDWAKDLNGVKIPLRSYSTGRRFDPEAGGASLGAALLLGPIGLAGGALVKGRQVTIRKGTRIQASVLPPAKAEAPAGR